MIEEPMYTPEPDIPPEIDSIISQLKLLYFVGGVETVRLALIEAGVEENEVEAMISALRESVGEAPYQQ